jgi:hypothetical protein
MLCLAPQRELDLISHPVLAISRGRVVELLQIQHGYLSYSFLFVCTAHDMIR